MPGKYTNYREVKYGRDLRTMLTKEESLEYIVALLGNKEQEQAKLLQCEFVLTLQERNWNFTYNSLFEEFIILGYIFDFINFKANQPKANSKLFTPGFSSTNASSSQLKTDMTAFINEFTLRIVENYRARTCAKLLADLDALLDCDFNFDGRLYDIILSGMKMYYVCESVRLNPPNFPS